MIEMKIFRTYQTKLQCHHDGGVDQWNACILHVFDLHLQSQPTTKPISVSELK